MEITQVTRFPNGFAITARDGKKQARGWITLTFTDAPVALTEWTVSDAQGARTRVKLTDLHAATGLDDAIFVLEEPAAEADAGGPAIVAEV